MTAALAVAGLLVFFRVTAFVVFLPPFGGRQSPQSVKVGLALALTVLWGGRVIPGVALHLNPQVVDNWMLLGWLAVRETLLGVSLGWLLGLILVPVRVAGAYIVQEMGLTMSSVTSATEASETNVISQLLETVAILFLLGANLHHQFLRLFDATFQMFPPAQAWELPRQEWLIGSIIRGTDQGLALAAPVGIVLFATLVFTLFVMRQAPQFNLFSFGTPVRLLVGLLAVLWFLPGIVAGMVHQLQSFASFQGW